MPDSPPYRDTGAEPASESPARVPRWVKVSLIVVAAIVVVVVVVMLLGGHQGSPGPGGH
jgi:hypothetical protein